MDIKNTIVSIEGDYVDSYIYSGFLVLVDIEYILTIYRWEDLLAKSLTGMDAFEYFNVTQLLLDSRLPFPAKIEEEYVIKKEILDTSIVTKYQIGVWPSDISIFANRLYISSENGILKMDLEFHTGMLSEAQCLFDEMCFSVSPNSYSRLAFAAGREGVFLLLPQSKNYDYRDVRQLIPNVCIDIDWQSTRLLANTIEGVVEAQFVEMPRKENYENLQDYFSVLKERRSILPSVFNRQELDAAWIAGDSVFSFDRKGKMDIKNIFGENAENVDYSINESKLLRARTAAFGTILEFEKSIIALIGASELNLPGDTVSWRVFPRAKNYANQLHLVKEDRIEINIIESVDRNQFGFDTENINTND